MDLRPSISSNSDSSIDLERRETIFDKGDFDPTWKPSDDDLSSSPECKVGELGGIDHDIAFPAGTSSQLPLQLSERVSEIKDNMESSVEHDSLLGREAFYSIKQFNEIDFTSSEETTPTLLTEAALGLSSTEIATSKTNIQFYCEGYSKAATALLEKHGIIPEPTSWASDALTALEQLPPNPSPAQVKSFIKNFEATIRTSLKEFLKAKLRSEPSNKEIQQLLQKDFYGKKANLKRAFKEELNKVRNTSAWPVIERNISFEDRTGTTHSMTSRMIPASKTATLQFSYNASKTEGISSFDRKNGEHAINLWIDTLHNYEEETPLLSVVRSGLHASIDLPLGNPTDPQTDREVLLEFHPESDLGSIPLSPRQEAFDARFNEALLASLESRGMLESTEVPIELTIADIGLLSYEGEEKAMKEAQFDYLQASDGKERTLIYKKTDGEEVILRVKPKIFAFNFGVQSYDKTLGQFYSQPINDASLDALLGEGGAVEQALQGISFFNGKELTDDDKEVIKELAEQCSNMRSHGAINAYDSDYYAFTARLVVLCDKLGIAPNIHCKSGKDRTSRLIEESKMLAAQIHINLKRRTLGQQDTILIPPYTGRALTDLTQIEMSLAFALGSGNAELQQLNTGLRGNKQSKALEWKLDIVRLKKELRDTKDPVAQKQLESSIEKIEVALREYEGLSSLAKS